LKVITATLSWLFFIDYVLVLDHRATNLRDVLYLSRLVDIYNSFGNGHLYMKAALTLLEGVRVVEVGSAIAAPLASMILSELGAEVVKVENVERGDDARFMGKRVKGESLYFFTYNKNKRSIAVNLKHMKGREILVKLVEKSDVLVENFRPRSYGETRAFLRGAK
jgi:hypothetical protein